MTGPWLLAPGAHHHFQASLHDSSQKEDHCSLQDENVLQENTLEERINKKKHHEIMPVF